MIVARVVGFLAGVFLLQATLRSALRTVVVPQGENVRLTRLLFLFLEGIYEPLARRHRDESRRHAVRSRFAPVATVLLAFVWAACVIIAFAPIYWSLGGVTVANAFRLSGSSFTTLGFADAPNAVSTTLVVIEALLGLGVVALLIAYLPSIYGNFARREEMVRADRGEPHLATLAGAVPVPAFDETLDETLDELAAAGIPVKADREQAWRDFAGWRVNYDDALLALSELCAAPSARWSADRLSRFRRPTLLHPTKWRILPLDSPRSW
jgi:hypothetical protein